MMYLFVEGFDDERYFSQIYGELWDNVKFIQYSGWTNVKINNFIKAISCTPTSDYIFIGDADGKAIEQKRQELSRKYPYLDSSKIVIVQYEIESWYYAGVSEIVHNKMKMKGYKYRTDQLTKEDFNAKLPRITDRKYVMSLILSSYELRIAIRRNTSLSIFDNNIKKEPA